MYSELPEHETNPTTTTQDIETQTPRLFEEVYAFIDQSLSLQISNTKEKLLDVLESTHHTLMSTNHFIDFRAQKRHFSNQPTVN